MEEREKSKTIPRDSVYYGLISGILEADYYQKPPVHNYSNDAWCWRGLTEVGRVLVEVDNTTQNRAMVKVCEECLVEAREYRGDILASIEKTYDKTYEPHFLSVIVGSKRPTKMTMDINTSYANYHLYADLLYSVFWMRKRRHR